MTKQVDAGPGLVQETPIRDILTLQFGGARTHTHTHAYKCTHTQTPLSEPDT